MLLAWVGKEVGLCAGLDAGIQETQAVLWYHSVIVITRDNLQLTLQVLGLADQTALGITLGVILWGTHIALAIHHLIPFPVDHRTACYTYLKHVGVVGHQTDGHESTKAPAVNTQSVCIHI